MKSFSFSLKEEGKGLQAKSLKNKINHSKNTGREIGSKI
jgi:hypothetical protein